MSDSESQPSLFAKSGSKINLFLEVVGRRPDGYHELDTIMLRTDFTDSMQFIRLPSPELRLTLSADTPASIRADFPLDERNLIIQVATSLQKMTNCRFGAEVIVHKQIPAQSGLAGGSGNAACTLRSLNRLWNLNLPDTELHRIAAAHGSDINFLLADCRAAVCRGRGELIHPIRLTSPLWLFAARPRTGNSTPAVFRSTQLPTSPRSTDETVAFLEGRIRGQLTDLCFNRLTEAAKQNNPEMALLMKSMSQQTDRPVYMSG
ncbi:MAG: 4-(cytidine 5'-diphospho)-2-C-methyl-D-erythritol kinase, partial [Planctomyces sp.]